MLAGFTDEPSSATQSSLLSPPDANRNGPDDCAYNHGGGVSTGALSGLIDVELNDREIRGERMATAALSTPLGLIASLGEVIEPSRLSGLWGPSSKSTSKKPGGPANLTHQLACYNSPFQLKYACVTSAVTDTLCHHCNAVQVTTQNRFHYLPCRKLRAGACLGICQNPSRAARRLPS